MKLKQHPMSDKSEPLSGAGDCAVPKAALGRKKAGRPLSFDRDKALEKAMLAFWKHGYETTSLNDLTTAMGITPPSLYGAFGDKEKLFMEAMLRYTERYYCAIEELLLSAPTARESMQKLLEKAAIEHTCPDHPPGCMVVTCVTNCTAASLHLQKQLAAVEERSRTTLVARIQHGIGSGELPQNTDAVSIADFYLAVLQGMTHQARNNASCQELQNIVKVAMAAWPSHPALESR